MPAYLTARVRVDNPEEFAKYVALAPDIIKKHGGKALSRGGRYQIMEGTDKFNRFVLIEFPSFDDAVRCIQSDEYQKAAAFRRQPGVAEIDQVIVDSGTA